MIEKKKQMRGQGGFTLIELLVVIAILAVLAGLAVIGIGAMRDNADSTACKADADTYETAAEAYNVIVGSYPAAATQASINGNAQAGQLLKRQSDSEAALNSNYNATTGQINEAVACP